MKARPYIVVIAGPNGAGKTTIARAVLAETFHLAEFVNADSIAAGLAAFNPEAAAIAAGRVMLTRLRELADARASFAFESTLASRTFYPWLRDRVADGYDVHIIYVALRSTSLAQRRVKARVRKGGHNIPKDTITRRFYRSAKNVLHLYMPLAATWRLYDNSGTAPVLAVTGGANEAPNIRVTSTWNALHEAAAKAAKDQRSGDETDEGRPRD